MGLIFVSSELCNGFFYIYDYRVFITKAFYSTSIDKINVHRCSNIRKVGNDLIHVRILFFRFNNEYIISLCRCNYPDFSSNIYRKRDRPFCVLFMKKLAEMFGCF